MLETEAREAQTNRLFASTDETNGVAFSAIERDIRKLRNRFGESGAQQYASMVVGGLVNQLYNFPLDFFIESRIHTKYPWLSDAQFASLAKQMQENQQAATDRQIRELAPQRVLQANQAMNAAMALFVDGLYNGATDYAAAYEAVGALKAGRELFKATQQALARWSPGSEYDLVDEWAKILHLQDWYIWAPDTTQKLLEVEEPFSSPETEDDDSTPPFPPELEAAATMYMVGALKTFAHLDRAALIEYVTEIAILGQSGLDYADSSHKYTLKTAPGKAFSGLQLMSHMYVGFKMIDPTVNTGIALENAYRQALILYEQGL